jgi:hypothetical protein
LTIFNKYKCNTFQNFQPLSQLFLEDDIALNYDNGELFFNKPLFISYLFHLNKSITRFLLFLNSQHLYFYNFSFFFFKGKLKYYITSNINNFNFLSFKSIKNLYFLT